MCLHKLPLNSETFCTCELQNGVLMIPSAEVCVILQIKSVDFIDPSAYSFTKHSSRAAQKFHEIVPKQILRFTCI